ncbi:MAG: 2-phosphosulfolactate phosphatase [Cyclobacteriaceae bacterium]|nr:2-phosphosulfolactate phosphatase [Cyclobacteriaceae bacterium]
MPKVEVCFSPELIHLFNLERKVVVVTDILRATSCMTAGIASGVAKIKPVATLEECSALKEEGYFTAAERNGGKVEGFDIGNSPYSYMEDRFKGKNIAATTTNGTLAITKSTAADEILIGSFLNLSTVANYLIKENKDVIIHCSGWKGNYSLEDTLFAGALIEKLTSAFGLGDDASFSAFASYKVAKNNLLETVLGSSHAKRLEKYDIKKDIELCCAIDKYDVLPFLQNGVLIKK